MAIIHHHGTIAIHHFHTSRDTNRVDLFGIATRSPRIVCVRVAGGSVDQAAGVYGTPTRVFAFDGGSFVVWDNNMVWERCQHRSNL